MSFLRLAALALMGLAMLATGCGGGSGRRGTDIVVSGTGPTEATQAGQSIVFQMTVRNAGDNTADPVTVTNIVGNGLTLNSITCTASGGAVCPSGTGPVMTVNNVPPGGVLSFAVTATLAPSANGTVTNSMTAEFDTDPDRSNNNFTVSAPAFNIVSDLAVTGVGPSGSVTGGAAIAFQMTVVNNGPNDASNLQFLNNAGTGIALNSVTCTASGGAVCPATLGASMTLATMPNASTLVFTINATVGNSFNGTAIDTFQVTADTDTSRSNNSFTATVVVVTPQTGVFVTGVGPTDTVTGGGPAVFTMTVGNAGPDASATVNIVDNVGSNLTFTGASCVATGGAVCPSPVGAVMTVTNMPANSSLVFTIDTVVAQGTNGTVTNQMSIKASNDTDASDNSATATATAVTPRATLVVSGSGPAQPVAGGDTAQFVMTLSNTGPSPATNVNAVNSVSGNLTFTGASCAASGGATCPASVGVVTNVGTLPVGGQLTLTVSALVGPGANGAITNTIQASADNAFAASKTAVGQAQTARSSLTVTGTGPSNAPAGSTTSFVMTVTNTGPDVAGSIHLLNTLGNNLTLISIDCTAGGGAVCPSNTGPTMDVSNVPVNGTLSFTVNASIAAGTQGSILNTLDATVTTGTRTEVVAVAVGNAYSNNVAVTGNAPTGPLAGGDSAVFTMNLSNTGSGPALNVDVSNTLSAGLSANGNISCLASGGAVCPAAPAATMTIASIPSGGSLTFSIPVAVVAGTNATVSDTMTASAAGDSIARDNSATASVVAVSPDLGVSDTGASQTTAGTTAVFTAVVSNPASAAASNVVLTHALDGAGAANTSATITCTPSNGAVCPSPLGPNMTLTSLPAGRTLTFTITVPVPAANRGAINSTFTATASGDPNGPNSAKWTTQAVDPRSGSYKAFAADGRLYDMSIDFDAQSYTMVGSSGTTNAQFSPDGTGGYIVAGNSRLRVAADLVVGGHDFGSGSVTPYIAARNFGSTVNETVGQYDQMTREVGPNSSLTHAAVMTISGNQMLVCQTDGGTIAQPGRCPQNKQKNYTLDVGGGGAFIATEVGGSSQFSFYLAKSGASKMILGAIAGNGSGILRIALQDSATLFGGTLSGSSTSGNWINAMTLTVSSYAVTNSGSDNATASLSVVPNTGVGSMLTGSRQPGGDLVWVMQSSPVAVMFADPTASPAVQGLVQIAVP